MRMVILLLHTHLETIDSYLIPLKIHPVLRHIAAHVTLVCFSQFDMGSIMLQVLNIIGEVFSSYLLPRL